jgi:hypothetical protein
LRHFESLRCRLKCSRRCDIAMFAICQDTGFVQEWKEILHHYCTHSLACYPNCERQSPTLLWQSNISVPLTLSNCALPAVFLRAAIYVARRKQYALVTRNWRQSTTRKQANLDCNSPKIFLPGATKSPPGLGTTNLLLLLRTF